MTKLPAQMMQSGKLQREQIYCGTMRRGDLCASASSELAVLRCGHSRRPEPWLRSCVRSTAAAIQRANIADVRSRRSRILSNTSPRALNDIAEGPEIAEMILVATGQEQQAVAIALAVVLTTPMTPLERYCGRPRNCRDDPSRHGPRTTGCCDSSRGRLNDPDDAVASGPCQRFESCLISLGTFKRWSIGKPWAIKSALISSNVGYCLVMTSCSSTAI
jgi:hypothetical protein